jgi:hypothetical protein
MRRIPFRFVLIAAVLAFVALPGETRAQNTDLPAGAPQSASTTPATFAAELRQLDERLGSKSISSEQIAAVRASIPSSWEVDSVERHYSISSQPLVSMLFREICGRKCKRPLQSGGDTFAPRICRRGCGRSTCHVATQDK